MRTAGSRPHIFLSSTIYDFADLRSAIKFWLEELGYDVDASEFNDFQKDVDKNSYEACLKTIDQADYFVLLLGSRAGGWYDEAAKTTITMMEYRRAYERARRGELKLLTFVRRSVWDVREDREALGRLLKADYAKEHGLSEEDVDKIKHHQSRMLTNAQTVFAFLAEVGRNAEMKEAAAGKGALPPANWIHRFEGFRDIADALRVDLGGALGLRRVALTTNLRHELVENLRHLLHKMRDGRVEPAYETASLARKQFSGGPNEASRIKGKRLLWLSMFALTGAKAGGRLAVQFLDEALVSGEFLDFNRTLDRYVVGMLQRAMIELKEEILRLRREETALSFEKRMQLVEAFRGYKDVDDLVEVENRHLVDIVSIHDRQANIVALSAALLRALDGDAAHLDGVKLYPRTPFVDEAKLISGETPSWNDVEAWIIASLKLKVGGSPAAI